MIRFTLTFLVRRLMLALIVLAGANVFIHGMSGASVTSRDVMERIAGLPKALETLHRSFR